MKLVDNWRACWRWCSVQCMLVAGAVQGAWIFIPDDMKHSLPPDVVKWCTLGLLALGVVGRVVKQEPPACPTPLPVIDPSLLPPKADK